MWTPAKAALLCLALLLGCADSSRGALIIELVPASNAGTDPFAGVQQWRLSLLKGDAVRKQWTIQRGEPLEVLARQEGNGHRLLLEGLAVQGTPVVVGRTRLFDLDRQRAQALSMYIASPGAFSRVATLDSWDDRIGSMVETIDDVLLIGGGIEGSEGDDDLYRYDPERNELVRNGDLQADHGRAGSAALDKERVVIAGGVDENLDPTAVLEVYDAASSTWQVGELPRPRADSIVAALDEERALVAGGRDGQGPLLTTAIVQANGNDINIAAGPELQTSRLGAAALPVGSGQVLLAGGHDTLAGAYAADAVLVTTDRAEVVTGSLSSPRAWPAVAELPDGSFLLIGGETTNGELTRSIERVSFDGGELTSEVVGNLPFTQRLGAAGTLHDGRVLIAGGDGCTGAIDPQVCYDPRNYAFLFDPDTGALQQQPGPGALTHGVVTVLPDTTAIVTADDAVMRFNPAP